MLNDKRIGIAGKRTADICAVCDKPVEQGCINVSLGVGYNARVHPKCQSHLTHQQLTALKKKLPKSEVIEAVETEIVAEDISHDDES